MLGGPEADGPDQGALRLCAPDRLLALAESGLTRAPDPDMEHYANRVRAVLAVPVALVSLVQADEQVFPGMVGLPEPWASRRATPLTHSFCQHVVHTAAPLVIPDARHDPRVRHNLAITELGVAAYAGMPLTDARGQVLGSLCAIDSRPHAWTDAELTELADLARACSTELRLRLSRHDADRERARRDELENALRSAYDHSQLLLSAAAGLNNTLRVSDVGERVRELLASELKPSHVELSVRSGPRRLQRVGRPGAAAEVTGATAGGLEEYGFDASWPSARAARRREVVVHHRSAADPPESDNARRSELDWATVVCAPLLSGEDVVGVLVLAWDQSRAVHPLELATISTVAGYTAQALQRSTVVEHATTVARELQSALLSDLPAVPGLQMAARYLPADVGEFIGGDWYDAVLVPSDHAPDHREVALSVGDVVGHGIQASASMGQVRAMLRQASWEHAARGPAASLASLENAVAGLDLGVRGSAVLAHLRRLDEGAWRLTWSNAGHPPPLLLQPDGSVSVLAEHDMLLGYPALRPRPRRDHQVRVEPGATLLLYTDGLIERRDADLDQGLAQLCERLAGLHGTPPEAALDALVGALGAQTPKDDTVLLAVQTDRRSRGHAGRATNRA